MSASASGHAAAVSRSQLMAANAGSAQAYAVARPELPGDAALLAGIFRADCLRTGLHSKCVDVTDLHDMRTEAMVEGGLNLLVVLAGRAQAMFGNALVGVGGAGAPEAALIALAGPERFVRQSQRGRHERKVVISMSPDWLDASGLDGCELGRFRQHHLAMRHWRPSTRMAVAAQQMISPPPMHDALQRLFLESRAIELVTETLDGLFDRNRTPEVSTRARRRIDALTAWLDEALARGEADALDLAAIARQAGLNASSLQQQFRAVQGTSIFAWLRGRRLDAARNALARDGASVAQAAELAGYGSAANFATAFRKRFGHCPSAMARALD